MRKTQSSSPPPFTRGFDARMKGMPRIAPHGFPVGVRDEMRPTSDAEQREWLNGWDDAEKWQRKQSDGVVKQNGEMFNTASSD